LTATPVQILQWFRSRCRSHFEEARAHLGLKSQWSSRAIARTTPALLALFSIVTLVAHQQLLQHPFELPAWYQKTLPTFADALALVRQQLWQMQTFQMSSADVDTVSPRALFNTWSDLLAMLPNKPILNIN